MADKTESEASTPKENKYKDGRWSVPGRRAKGYAEERKAKVHKWGQKQGKELTDYEAGLRSGYLQSQNDHAGLFKYSKLRDAGFNKKDAGEFARKPWKEVQKIIAKKKKGGDAA